MHRVLAKRIGAVALIGTSFALGCGRAAARVSDAPQPLSADRDACWLAPPPQATSDSLLIVIHGWAGNGPAALRFDEGRRLVASFTDEGRTVADCAGGPIPGATIPWFRDSSARGERYRSRVAGPALRVATIVSPADPRDALDRGADLLITADRAGVAYARALGDRVIVPLPMRWSYGVLTARAAGTDSLTNPALAQLRVSLSRDVVPASARAVVDSGSVSTGCVGGSSVARASRSRIVYHADDPVAHAIAGRLVSLAAAGDATVRGLVPHDGAPLVAAPLDPGAFAAALANGDDAAYVVAWPKATGDRCAVIASRAIRDARGDVPPAGDIVVTPLIDAGQWAIVRRGTMGLVIDARGDLRLVAPAGPRMGAP